MGLAMSPTVSGPDKTCDAPSRYKTPQRGNYDQWIHDSRLDNPLASLLAASG